jgi:hypothetical protein
MACGIENGIRGAEITGSPGKKASVHHKFFHIKTDN